MAALVMVGAMMSSCAEEVEVVQPTVNGTVTMKTTISLDGKSATRALTEAGVKTFAAGDQIAIIYKNTAGETVKAESVALTAADIDASDAHKATFTVDLTNPKASEAVRYVYPASRAAASIAADAAVNGDATINFAALATQDGTFASLANDLDLAVYDGTMTSVGALPTGAGVILENLLTILKLQSIKNDAGVAILDKITSLTVDDGTNTYTVTRTAANAPIYVAMLPVAGDITISTTYDNIPYTKTATGKTLAKNKICPVNLTMAQDFLATPLTFEAAVAGAQVNFDINTNAATNGVQYRTFSTASGWSDWATYTDNAPVVLASVGDIVQFRGDNATYGSEYPYSNIQFDQDCYAYGNIMSLIKSTGFSTETTLTGIFTFPCLFESNTYLKSHTDKPLMLPATTLAKYCYYYMFNGCTSLETAPILPAETLTNFCYSGMFKGCTRLAAAPALPATTLAEYCYYYMFNGCTSLAAAPALPAKNLDNSCYYSMFYGCNSLNAVPELPATKMYPSCYREMFKYCIGLTSVPADLLPATTLDINCYDGMFSGCQNLETAPILPAKTLAKECYYSMFDNCYNLSSVTCLATNISAQDCLKWWLNVAGVEGVRERIVYVDPSMLTVATGDSDGQWRLTTSGQDDKRWTLAAANRYPLVAANAEAIDLGKVIASDGKIYPNTAAASKAGKTGVAVIVYVDDGTCEDEPYNHGLALALSDANGAGKCGWGPKDTDAGHSKQTSSSFTSESGLQYNATHNTDTYPAFKAVISNNNTAAPSGCSAWFLPTGYQWNQMITAVGGATQLRDCFSNVGGTNMKSSDRISYWLASEEDAALAWGYCFNPVGLTRNSKNSDCYVRSALAF